MSKRLVVGASTMDLPQYLEHPLRQSGSDGEWYDGSQKGDKSVETKSGHCTVNALLFDDGSGNAHACVLPRMHGQVADCG